MLIGYEYLLPGAENSGVEVTIQELLRAMSAALVDDTLEVFVSGRNVSSGIPASSRVSTRVARFARHGRWARVAWQQAGLPLALRRRAVDVYHATGYVVSPMLPVPSVVSVYDTIALDNPHLTRRLNALHYQSTVPHGVRAASRVVVPSEHVRRRLVALAGIRDERIAVIPLGVSERFTRMDSEAAEACLRRLHGLCGAPFLLFVGNLEKKKNLAVLLAAFCALREEKGRPLKLVLAGRPANDAENLRRLVRASGCENDVLFPGYVSHEMLLALYAKASLLVYPSLDEGFGLPPLEAMRCGLPVVASDAGALPEVMGDAALLCDARSPRAFVEAIRRLLSDPALYCEYAARGATRAARFTWQACASRTMDVYRNLVTAASPERLRAAEEALS